ncbi:hypothetical protein ACO2Q3_11350 [Caulobacter sp. KR2-114]|uniref:hypothetical protein n=1 Tax=Caulobacter sp. KR2-114 TaxID=3400912 RepID=UPI003C04CDEE
MAGLLRAPPRRPFVDLTGPVAAILAAQRPDGAIPWFEGGPWDPWNHAECVMALDAMGEFEAADAGFDHLQASQLPDGAWLGEYGNALPMAGRLKIARQPAPAVRDANFTAYPAVAVWRRYLATRDLGWARRRWPMVRAAIGYVLSLQHPHGDVSWCGEAHGGALDDALVAGNASIYAALGCAIRLAGVLGEPAEAWTLARARLRRAILCAPERYGRRGGVAGPGGAFAMDWYYPILAGVMTPAAAFARLEAGAARFMRRGLGCRCVSGEPWVTVAESCEFALALIRLGNLAQAEAVLSWQDAQRDADGAYWMGWQFEEQIFWPQEKPSWTQAAAILAHDALAGESAASAVLVTG